MNQHTYTTLTTTPHGTIAVGSGRVLLTTPCCGTTGTLDTHDRPICAGCGTTVDIAHTWTAAARHPVAVSIIRGLLERTGTPPDQARTTAPVLATIAASVPR